MLLDTVGIAGCVTKMGADALDCVAGIDGSVFNLYPKFQEYIKEGLAELGVHCAIESSADGSGLGAAVIAATAGTVVKPRCHAPAMPIWWWLCCASTSRFLSCTVLCSLCRRRDRCRPLLPCSALSRTQFLCRRWWSGHAVPPVGVSVHLLASSLACLPPPPSFRPSVRPFLPAQLVVKALLARVGISVPKECRDMRACHDVVSVEVVAMCILGQTCGACLL